MTNFTKTINNLESIDNLESKIDNCMNYTKDVENNLSIKLNDEVEDINKKLTTYYHKISDLSKRVDDKNSIIENKIENLYNTIEKSLDDNIKMIKCGIISLISMIIVILISISINITSICKYNKLENDYSSLTLKNIELTKQIDEISLVINNSNLNYIKLNLTDITSPSNLTAAQLNEIINNRLVDINKKNSKMHNIGETLIAMENEHKVNALFCIAVGSLESGYGTSEAAIDNNNLFGIMIKGKIKHFNSINECILYWGKLIRENYINEGRTSIEKIQTKYCPSNSNWDNRVMNIMEIYTNYIKN